MCKCRFYDLRKKEVINQCNGYRIGFVDDLEINTKTADLCSLIVYGRSRFFGIFGRENDCIIPWQNIKLIGEDTILVDFNSQREPKPSKSRFFGKN